jgi:ABC-2 type transport system ATP-binding protein
VATADVQNDHLFINLREETDTAPLVSLMVGAGVQIEEVRKDKASLEEVFLTLMQEDK